jgi:hypothetical protein
MSAAPQRPDQPAVYEIRVRGRLGATVLGAFPTLRAEWRGPDTVLRGPLPDQAALHGVLAQIERLALELLEVRRPGAESSSEQESPEPGDGG